MKKNICVFGGSNSGKNSENKRTALLIGKIIAENNFNIIFGGGEKGIMGSVASSGIKNGANTTGVIPKFLMQNDMINLSDSNLFNKEIISTETMHERKKIMYDLSDAFLILPGGVGTLDECFEVLTWCQLNLIKNKNVGIINFYGYWDLLISLINHIVEEKFMSSFNLDYFTEITDIKTLKKFLKKI